MLKQPGRFATGRTIEEMPSYFTEQMYNRREKETDGPSVQHGRR
jgi:hypothetical protein